MPKAQPKVTDADDLAEEIDFDAIARKLLAAKPKPQAEVRPDPASKRGRPKKAATGG
jgi:hypothetical protein